MGKNVQNTALLVMGMPEVSANNKSFSSSRTRLGGVDMAEFVKVAPAVAPQENEIVVVKRRVSGFTGSDLEVV